VEHRWGKRVSVSIPVRFSGRDGGAAQGYIVNISGSGALIRAAQAVHRLARVDVDIDGHIFPSYVSRVDGSGFAVEWCESPPNSLSTARYTSAETPTEPAAAFPDTTQGAPGAGR